MAFGSKALSPTQLLLFILLFMALISIKPAFAHAAAAAMRPVVPASGPQSVLVSESQRRRLGSFRICALCTCCGGPRGFCLPSPCCYSINCNIPNRPFGFCSFTPKTCNCLGCHL